MGLGYWHHADWAYRYPAAINASASAGGTLDVSIDIPPGWDHFWENVESDGADVRVYSPVGTDPLVYQLVDWDSTTRTGSIEIDGAVIDPDSIHLFWVYYGNANATDAQGSFTASSPLVGNISTSRPTGPVIVAGSEAPGATTPTQEVSKANGERIIVWWDVTGLLADASTPVNGHTDFESVLNINEALTGAYSAGTIDTGMTFNAYYFVVADSKLYAGITIEDGTDGDSYELLLVVKTVILASVTAARILHARALLKVNDPAEPS